ncbi:MAG: type II toxin-antitoxin system death-on-curing family toxin [Clostridia bacterium]|nr:type II toxin-antitoxin system death-on-curing family toxin [Clostridia bacterium]
MISFTQDRVLFLQKLVIEVSGGSNGVRDYNLLESALQSTFQTFGGVELYPSIEEKGAWLGFSLVSNHAFVDGNKRIGLLIMLTFLSVNGINLQFTDDELIDLGLGLASGKYKYLDLLNWLNNHKC